MEFVATHTHDHRGRIALALNEIADWYERLH
jgi:hypothetical protein